MDTPQTKPEEQTSSSVKSRVSLTPSSSTVCPKELADSEQKQPNDACVSQEHAQNRTSDDRNDGILTNLKNELINNIDEWQLLSYSLDAVTEENKFESSMVQICCTQFVRTFTPLDIPKTEVPQIGFSAYYDTPDLPKLTRRRLVKLKRTLRTQRIRYFTGIAFSF